MKHTRYREMPGNRKVKRIEQAFLKSNPDHLKVNPAYRCPAGPGLHPVDVDGAWYDLTDYLRRRYACGDVVDGTPPAEHKPAKAKPATEEKTK